MKNALWLANTLSKKHLERKTAEYLDDLSHEPIRKSRRAVTQLLERLRSEPGTKVCLGETLWGDPVEVPLRHLVKACGLTTGGMGSGKTMFSLLTIQAMIQLLPNLRSMCWGVLDPKCELFERGLYLLVRRLEELDEQAQEALLRRIVVIDFASREAITSYNILARWPDTETDFFINSRLETLRELLPAGEKLSPRGAGVLKKLLALLSEFGLPLTYLDRVLSSDALRQKLVLRSRNPDVKLYFRDRFPQEGRQTIHALRARMDTLFASEGVRLALSGSTAPDFRRLQNEGKIVLINCAGPTISRGVRLLLQGLILSDIRQSIFARPNEPPVTYLWVCDEAQNFFLTRQQQEDMADILTMARSFGSFFSFLCQNITTAVPDSRLLGNLYTNIRWAMTMRGTPRDAMFLRSALPVTGRRRRPESHPFREPRTYSPEEERSLALDGIANLPDREGYLWFKAQAGAEAVRIRTRRLDIPKGEAFRRVVDEARSEPLLGGRLSRQAYEHLIETRDREWLGEEEETRDLPERMERTYREGESRL